MEAFHFDWEASSLAEVVLQYLAVEAFPCSVGASCQVVEASCQVVEACLVEVVLQYLAVEASYQVVEACLVWEASSLVEVDLPY